MDPPDRHRLGLLAGPGGRRPASGGLRGLRMGAQRQALDGRAVEPGCGTHHEPAPLLAPLGRRAWLALGHAERQALPARRAAPHVGAAAAHPMVRLLQRRRPDGEAVAGLRPTQPHGAVRRRGRLPDRAGGHRPDRPRHPLAVARPGARGLPGRLEQGRDPRLPGLEQPDQGARGAGLRRLPAPAAALARQPRARAGRLAGATRRAARGGRADRARNRGARTWTRGDRRRWTACATPGPTC